MRAFFNSLRFRLLILVLLAVFPAFGLALDNASTQRQMAVEKVEEDALQLAWITSDHLNELIESSRQLLLSLARMPILTSADPAQCSRFLADIKKDNPRYGNILKVDLNGRIICDAISSGFLGQIPADGFPQGIVESKTFTIGNYVISPTTHKPTIGFGYPLTDENGNVTALLIVGLDLGSLNDMFSDVQLPLGSTLTLRDRNGTILSHYPDPEKWAGQVVSEFLDPGQQVDFLETGTIQAQGKDGVDRLYAYTPLRNAPKAGLSFMIGIPKTAAFAEADRTLTNNLLTLGSVTIAAFLIAWIYSDLSVLRQIRTILKMTERLAAGDLSTRTGEAYDDGELGQLARAFDHMAAALEKRGIEANETHEALEREERAHARLLHQVITAHEDERMRIARELHDETSQSLTALMIGLERTRLEIHDEDSRANAQLQNVKNLADLMLTDIHRLIGNLRPSLLDDLGLVPAIAWFGEKLVVPAGIDMKLTSEGLDERLPRMVETEIFRVAQEALTNCVRHSNATRVEVSLCFVDQKLCLNIKDDGQGYSLADAQEPQTQMGFGLESMRERITILEGNMQIFSAPGHGTEISVQVPISNKEEEVG